LNAIFSIKHVTKSLSILGMVFISLMFADCANQQPPGGGEEDKTPPKVKIISPAPNSVNFRGSSVSFEFNEYVDRRSFQDAFRISPQVKGDLEFNWGAKDVEVIFPADLYKTEPNKTFVLTLNSSLKDIRGNPITEPLSFAFSTGNKIDMGSVSGKVSGGEGKIVSIMAYDLKSTYDPQSDLPDYATETSSEGAYSLLNMAPGNYRVIAVIDEDKNLLYTNERESFGVLPYDVEVKDSVNSPGVNFFLKLAMTQFTPAELDYTKYYKDSLGIVYTSIEPGTLSVLPDQSIFIFFSRNKPTREELTGSLKITGEDGITERAVYNWKNDSLVEVFAQNRLRTNTKYRLSFPVKLGVTGDTVYNFSLTFRTVSVNSFGDIKGRVISSYIEYPLSEYPAKIEMTADKLLPVLRYSYDVRDSVFAFKNILDASYRLFAYIDKNNNGVYDHGNPYPFVYSEPFVFYPAPVNIKGGWTVENVNVNFVK